MSAGFVIIAALVAGWLVQIFFTYRQSMAFNDDVRKLRASGTVSVGVGGNRYKGRRSFVTSAGAGPSVGKHLLMAYLPPEHAREGERLVVEYMHERYPVTVAVAGSTPIFDPENTRIRS